MSVELPLPKYAPYIPLHPSFAWGPRVPPSKQIVEGETSHAKVRRESIEESRKGDARAKRGNAEEWAIRQKSYEQEAGDRNRTFGGSRSGGQGAAQEIF